VREHGGAWGSMGEHGGAWGSMGEHKGAVKECRRAAREQNDEMVLSAGAQ